MSRRRLGLVAAAATLLAAAPLASVFDNWVWLIQSTVAVCSVTAAATAVRSLGGRLWAQVPAMTVALLITLTFLFGENALLRLIPTSETFTGFSRLLVAATDDIRTSIVPAASTPGLLFLTVLGIGSTAILIDVLAVGLHRPALAGLPMLAVYAVPVAVHAGSVPALPFLFGAGGYLWLLAGDNLGRIRRFGRRFTGDGRNVEVWEPSPLAAVGRRLALTGMVLAVVLPLAMPGLTTGLPNGRFGGQGTGGQAGRGPSSGRVDLFAELTGRLTQGERTDMVRVRTDEQAPFYLRFAVADDIVDSGFRSSAPNGEPVTDQLPAAAGLNRTDRRYRARIEVLDTFNMPLLPVYASPTSIKGLSAAWSYDVGRQVVFSQRESSAGRSYELEYIRARYTAEQLREAQPLPLGDRIQQRYAEVIEIPVIRRRVDDLIEGEQTVYDKVRALHDFFSRENGFTYDENAPTGTSGDKIVDFLSQRRGFCEQYAAALTWMVRTAGIPARVAFGFTRGAGASSPDGAVLTNRNLHAWTEVYFDGFGWVPFDATPSLYVTGSVNLPHDPDPDRTEAPETPEGPSAAPGATGEPQATRGPGRDPFDDVGGGDIGGQVSGPQPTPMWVWSAYAGAAALLTALMMPAARRVMLRRRRRLAEIGKPRPAPDDPTGSQPSPGVLDEGHRFGWTRRLAHAAWDELVDTMVDLRVPVDPAETPRGTADRLIRLYRLDRGSAHRVKSMGRAEEQARYAARILPAPDLVGAVEEVRAVMLRQATRKMRLIATVMPPSVVQRWRADVSAAALLAGQWTAEAGAWLRRLWQPLSPSRLFRRRA